MPNLLTRNFREGFPLELEIAILIIQVIQLREIKLSGDMQIVLWKLLEFFMELLEITSIFIILKVCGRREKRLSSINISWKLSKTNLRMQSPLRSLIFQSSNPITAQ